MQIIYTYSNGVSTVSKPLTSEDVPLGHRVFDELDHDDRIAALNIQKKVVLDRFITPGTVDDLPEEVKQHLLGEGPQDPTVIFWRLATDDVCRDWVDHEALRLARAVSYSPAANPDIVVQQLPPTS